jgi:hypothetical protein
MQKRVCLIPPFLLLVIFAQLLLAQTPSRGPEASTPYGSAAPLVAPGRLCSRVSEIKRLPFKDNEPILLDELLQKQQTGTLADYVKEGMKNCKVQTAPAPA